jgi:hypothetical protein
MKKLKVYSLNMDGKRRGIVAAHSKTEAARLFRTSMHHFNGYGHETGNKEDTAIALSKPGIVFTQSYADRSAEYKEK